MRVSAALAAALLLTGCASATSDPGARSDGNDLSGSLTVAAAASLEVAFETLAAEFSASHPGVQVHPLILDGSSTLATQLAAGAPFDVFAAANVTTMEHVHALVSEPAVFATNTLQLAVAPGNPLGIESLDDLDDLVGLDVVLCARHVPCGDASAALLDAAGVSITPVSEEQNVTAVLTKVRGGEADAGLVYVTDIAAAIGAVTGVDLGAHDVDASRYPIAVVAESPNAEVARAFVDFVLSARGQHVLADVGFGSP